jgi:hypothetical protein
MSDNLVLERPTRPPDMGLPPRPAPPRPPGPIPAPVPPQLLPHRRPAELAGSSAFPADRASAKKAPDTGKSGKILEQKLGLRRTGLTGPHQTDSGGRVRPTCGQEQAERPRKSPRRPRNPILPVHSACAGMASRAERDAHEPRLRARPATAVSPTRFGSGGEFDEQTAHCRPREEERSATC